MATKRSAPRAARFFRTAECNIPADYDPVIALLGAIINAAASERFHPESATTRHPRMNTRQRWQHMSEDERDQARWAAYHWWCDLTPCTDAEWAVFTAGRDWEMVIWGRNHGA